MVEAAVKDAAEAREAAETQSKKVGLEGERECLVLTSVQATAAREAAEQALRDATAARQASDKAAEDASAVRVR